MTSHHSPTHTHTIYRSISQAQIQMHFAATLMVPGVPTEKKSIVKADPEWSIS